MIQREFVSEGVCFRGSMFQREYVSEGVCFRRSLFQKEDQVRVDLHKEKFQGS